jgi:hypothetical protein
LLSKKKGPAEAEPKFYTVMRLANRSSPAFAATRLRRATFAPHASEGWWAHQDSNLEQAGYEPAALTVELWARTSVSEQLAIL